VKFNKRNRGVQAAHIKFKDHTAQAVRADELPDVQVRPLATERERSDRLATAQGNWQLPEWYPCLCNGGWDPCPVCQCGTKDEPPCLICGGSPIEGEAVAAAIAGALASGESHLDNYALAAARADELAWMEQVESGELEDTETPAEGWTPEKARARNSKCISEAPEEVRRAALDAWGEPNNILQFRRKGESNAS